MGIPNIMIVRMQNQPYPPFRQHALPLKPLKRVVWSIIGDSGSKDNDKKPDLDPVINMSSDFPNLTGAIMDDFFHDNPDNPGRFTADQVAEFKQRLQHEAARPLDLYVVVYSKDLTLPIKNHLSHVDAVTFWTWHSRDLNLLESNFRKLEEELPSKRKLLGLYMWDFGASAPMPMDAMKYQCRLGLEWLKTRRIEGLIFLSNCIADLDLEAVEYARNLIAIEGEKEIT